MKHRTALVSALSITGVLLAGATALAANLGIVRSTAPVGELSPVVDGFPAAETTASTAAGAELVGYRVAGVGIVTLGHDGERLTLESADVGAWSYSVAADADGLAVTFSEGDREVELRAVPGGAGALVEAWEATGRGSGAGDAAQRVSAEPGGDEDHRAEQQQDEDPGEDDDD